MTPMPRALRLLSILDMLRERPHSTEELAERLDVSPRTIQQDLQDLAGPPMYVQLVYYKESPRWGLLRNGHDRVGIGR